MENLIQNLIYRGVYCEILQEYISPIMKVGNGDLISKQASLWKRVKKQRELSIGQTIAVEKSGQCRRKSGYLRQSATGLKSAERTLLPGQRMDGWVVRYAAFASYISGFYCFVCAVAATAVREYKQPGCGKIRAKSTMD